MLNPLRRSSIIFCASIVVMCAALVAPRADAETACDFLRTQTQAFSDAGQRGDGAAMGAMLDEHVIFFNEGGDAATRADMAAATPSAAPAGVTTVMSVTDWNCALHGDVAVTSFIDDQQQTNHGEAFHARYRSVETWARERGAWRMIGSQTLALPDDPRAVALPASLLDQYVGTYQSASGQQFVLTRDGDGIAASTGGVPAVHQLAEAPDVLFTPGRSRYRKVFERDDQGHVIGFFVRREGHDTHFRRV